MNNQAFEIGRQIGNSFGKAYQKRGDESAIEGILSQAMESGDPAVLQQSMGKILSQVSPERQGAAIQYLQHAYTNALQKQERSRLEEQGRQAALEGGYTFGAPPAVQAAQVKENSKQARLNQYGLGQNQSYNIPNTENGTSPQFSGINENMHIPTPSSPSVFKKLNDDQLVLLTGAQDREVSEPAKAELKLRTDEKDLAQKRNDNWTKFGMDRAKKVLDNSDEIAQGLPIKKTALNLMVDNIAKKNLGWWTFDNLAEITGIEGLRSPEGALFKTSGKEYFLGSIARAGARPNQWVEQQIADMLTKVGRSTIANLSVSRALQNEIDLEEERVRLTDEIYQDLRKKGDDIGDLGPTLNKRMKTFAEDKEKELFNDLRAMEVVEEGKPKSFRKVKQGTSISNYMVEALLNMFNNDPEKAAKEAKKLGYSFE